MNITRFATFTAPDGENVHPVQDHEALKNGNYRFIGRHWQFTPAVVSEGGAIVEPAVGGWPSTGEPMRVVWYEEYRAEVRAGNIVPADETTAKLCGVPYVKR